MKNIRILQKRFYSTVDFGWKVVRWESNQDFCIRCVCSSVGLAEIFDQAINSNYWAIKVVEGFDVSEIRKNFESIEFVEDDFAVCTSMNFFDQEKLIEKYQEVIDVD